MSDTLQDNVVADAGLAVKLGGVLCEALYRDLAQQRPLVATDEECYWRVEGCRNRDGAINGIAEFFLSIEKCDGRVTDIGEYLRCPQHPSVAAMIEAPNTDHEMTTKPSGSALLLTSIARGGVVFSADTAVKIGELYCETHYDDLQLQAPLAAIDKETYWRVEGRWNSESKASGAGQFFISIEKYDARVTEIGEANGTVSSEP